MDMTRIKKGTRAKAKSYTVGYMGMTNNIFIILLLYMDKIINKISNIN